MEAIISGVRNLNVSSVVAESASNSNTTATVTTDNPNPTEEGVIVRKKRQALLQKNGNATFSNTTGMSPIISSKSKRYGALVPLSIPKPPKMSDYEIDMDMSVHSLRKRGRSSLSATSRHLRSSSHSPPSSITGVIAEVHGTSRQSATTSRLDFQFETKSRYSFTTGNSNSMEMALFEPSSLIECSPETTANKIVKRSSMTKMPKSILVLSPKKTLNTKMVTFNENVQVHLLDDAREDRVCRDWIKNINKLCIPKKKSIRDSLTKTFRGAKSTIAKTVCQAFLPRRRLSHQNVESQSQFSDSERREVAKLLRRRSE